VSADRPTRVCIVTGTRAECGLLEPVMRAVQERDDLRMQVVVAGAHLLPPAFTRREVERRFPVDEAVYMQAPDRTGRSADSAALGRGVSGFAEVFGRLDPDWVVVLGDRIEAFAAAAAASVGGVGVAHIHGGDRAEGVADEAMRHAISKLAHLHLAATAESAARLEKMGEAREAIRIVGSPAIDGLRDIAPLDDEAFGSLGRPEVVLLLHPCGRRDDEERTTAERALRALEGRRVLALHPNHDAGRDGVLRAIEAAGAERRATVEAHLPRARFVALLKRVAASGGALVGNSSAGLIEAAALRCPVVDIGPRQGGRERPGHVVHTDDDAPEAVARAVREALGRDLAGLGHPYGDGCAGARIAAALADAGKVRDNPARLRKRCSY
jgi:UDP-hydrolysing UDP-N-acetyl-D-glucosamine 2-epimerase